jgi:hypothetical protein
MTGLLIVIFICAVLLGLTGSLPIWASGLLAVASLSSLAWRIYSRKAGEMQLNRRRLSLKASWGAPVIHLGGLPIPLHARGNIFLLADQVLIETDQDHLSVPLKEIKQILLTRADLVRRISDQQICRLMESGSCRNFSALREMIRHHDRMLHNASILILVVQNAGFEPDMLLLVVEISPPRMASLLRHSMLDQATQVRLRLG